MSVGEKLGLILMLLVIGSIGFVLLPEDYSQAREALLVVMFCMGGGLLMTAGDD